MAVNTGKQLLEHYGHNVVVMYYGDIDNPVSITIECEDCGTVLVDMSDDIGRPLASDYTRSMVVGLMSLVKEDDSYPVDDDRFKQAEEWLLENDRYEDYVSSGLVTRS